MRVAIGPVQLDLAQRGDVAEADPLAHRSDLAVDRLQPILVAGAREILRPKPRPGFNQHRAMLLCPFMRWRPANRPERLAAMVSGEGADRHWRVRWPKSRRASSGIERPVSAAIIAKPTTLPVRPWSVAMPSVV